MHLARRAHGTVCSLVVSSEATALIAGTTWVYAHAPDPEVHLLLQQPHLLTATPAASVRRLTRTPRPRQTVLSGSTPATSTATGVPRISCPKATGPTRPRPREGCWPLQPGDPCPRRARARAHRGGVVGCGGLPWRRPGGAAAAGDCRGPPWDRTHACATRSPGNTTSVRSCRTPDIG